MIYPIAVYGHPALRKETDEIDENYEGLEKLIEDMFATMYKSDGIGLAAPQIGKTIRLMVIDADPLSEDFPELAGFKKVFINPIIIEESGDIESIEEGCLSIPGIRENVKRHTKITIEYEDENFNLHEEVYEGFAARVLLHEYDHIEQKLFVDHVSPLRRKFLKGKLQAISKGNVQTSYRIITG